MEDTLKIGTRGSTLAMYQAQLVKAKIERDFPCRKVEIVKIKTSGDMIRRGGPAPFETKRVFTREIEEALSAGTVDLAVHSAKDMAVDLPKGLAIGAVLEREDPRDALVSKDKLALSKLPCGARIGTSSLRRKMQLLRLSPELVIEEVHGNVETRIRKMEEGHYDAIVLAYAGLKRLGLINYVAELLPEDRFYPAPGQGAIVVEVREKDRAALGEIMHCLNHTESAVRLECERAFLRTLEGGCQLPCGITTELTGGKIKTAGALFALEERRWVEDRYLGATAQPVETGRRLALQILEKGGREILEKIRHTGHPKT